MSSSATHSTVKNITTPGSFWRVVLCVFFVFSLLLGDGKQSFVVAYFGEGILASILVYIFYDKQSFRALPRRILALWLGLFATLVSSAFFSASSSYSITSIVIFCEGFLVYYLFYSAFSTSLLSGFSLGLLWAGVGSTITAILILLVNINIFPSGMNFFYGSYGHNHLIDLLLLSLPFSIEWYSFKRTPQAFVAMNILFLGALLSFARGGWVLLLGYLLYKLAQNKKESKFLWVYCVCFVISITSIVSTAYVRDSKLNLPQPWRRYVQKPSPLKDSRLLYWKQASDAFKASPIIGNGPGTFSILSKKYQTSEGQFSWYAHSYPLEMFAESGVVGGVIFLVLIIFHFITAQKMEKNSKEEGRRMMTGLKWGAILTLLYSFYEMNLNFLIIWVLFWGIIGLFTGFSQPEKKPLHHKQLPLLLVVVCVIALYALGMMSFTVHQIFKISTYSPLAIIPFSTDGVITYLSIKPFTQVSELEKFEKNIVLFNKHDPEVLEKIADSYVYLHAYTQASIWYASALEQDPFNVQLLKQLSLAQLKTPSPAKGLKEIIEIILTMKSLHVTDRDALLYWEYYRKDMPGDSSVTLVIDELKSSIEKKYSQSEIASRLFYSAGLAAFRDRYYKLAYALWRLSLSTEPNSSWYYVELANMYNFFGEEKNALKILQSCLDIVPGSINGCSYFYGKGKLLIPLFPPGTFKSKII